MILFCSGRVEVRRFFDSSSASKIVAPLSLKKLADVDYPEPIPPVIPSLYIEINC